MATWDRKRAAMEEPQKGRPGGSDKSNGLFTHLVDGLLTKKFRLAGVERPDDGQ